ncbi:hypothetical protein P168DRAFT_251605 [Aspergillus campestris IBT 28561]|uniref:F-box domain-containing protein n=1 Tax=Aspergillus campestris (strain IBT 28561) TaxID=1392248 RepID=A0A2I1D4I2_ASPC2|nr:uncharacterized protein P168DRAFT_251605 [Aspergillus campestris IBT 28561]PKY04775.1 hypothetical protein P168DRAFT_251605 [Aspergillus campestris IBT 28561]
MSSHFNALPLEVILHILSYLPFEALVAFGGVSRASYRAHILCLRRLRLAVFEKRIHCMISHLQAGWATPEQVGKFAGDEDIRGDYTISIIQPNVKRIDHDAARKPSTKTNEPRSRSQSQQDRSRVQDQMIRMQNRVFTKLVNRYGPSLIKLEFMAYDIDIEGAQALSTKCQHTLRHLALRFEHPHIRDGYMRPSSWLHPAPASTVWNLLIGIGQYQGMGMSGLESLVMERAGITPWQLMMLVRNNPRLTVLKMRTCRGVQPEFLDWLGGVSRDTEEEDFLRTEDKCHVPGENLEVLWLENCHQIVTKSHEHPKDLAHDSCDLGLEWVRGLKNLKSLSLNECMNISSECVDRANQTIWKIDEVVLPYSYHSPDSTIEVDPALL